MKNELQSNIKEAERFFVEFEHSRDHKNRLKYFKKALTITTKILDNDSPKNTIQEINNLNYLYTRKLIEELSPESSIPLPEEEWLKYLIIVEIENKDICKKVLQDNRDLNNIWISFLESWRDDFDYVRRHLERKYQ